MPKPSQCLLGGFSPLYCFPRKGDFPVRYQLVSILSALLLCLTMLAAIVYGVGTQPSLMQTLMLRTAPPEATGFPAEQYGAAAKLITDYLKGEGDFQLVFSMNGIAYNAFNEREQTHMADVRTLFSLCRRFSHPPDAGRLALFPETAVLLANRPANRLLYAGVCRPPCAAGGDGF